MGGASTAADTKDYHYVLFGRQTDDRHPDQSGVYFEFDDQIHGEVDSVARVLIAEGIVAFEFKNRQSVVVRRGIEDPSGIHF